MKTTMVMELAVVAAVVHRYMDLNTDKCKQMHIARYILHNSST